MGAPLPPGASASSSAAGAYEYVDTSPQKIAKDDSDEEDNIKLGGEANTTTFKMADSNNDPASSSTNMNIDANDSTEISKIEKAPVPSGLTKKEMKKFKKEDKKRRKKEKKAVKKQKKKDKKVRKKMDKKAKKEERKFKDKSDSDSDSSDEDDSDS